MMILSSFILRVKDWECSCETIAVANREAERIANVHEIRYATADRLTVCCLADSYLWLGDQIENNIARFVAVIASRIPV